SLIDLDVGLLLASDTALAFLVDLVLDSLRALFFPDVRVGDQPGFVIQLLAYEVTVHVRSQEIRASNQVVQVQGTQLRNRQELEVVVNSAGLAGREGVGVVGVLRHFFDEVVQERAPLGSRSKLRNEERVLL